MSQITRTMINGLKRRLGKPHLELTLKPVTIEEVFEIGKDNKGIYFMNDKNELLVFEEWHKVPVSVLQSEGKFFADLGYYLKA